MKITVSFSFYFDRIRTVDNNIIVNGTEHIIIIEL